MDGMPSKLLVKIVPLTLDTFVIAFNEFYKHGLQLDQSLKSAYIRLVPKGGDPTVLKNWRPITIISSVNKLFCKVVYNRIEKLIDDLLGPTQFAYRKSKDISNVTLNLNELIFSIKNLRDSKLLLSLDFSAAFDSLDHNFICDVLKLLNFPSFLSLS